MKKITPSRRVLIRWQALAALAALLLSLAAVSFSSASFSFLASSPGNTFSAGSISTTNSKEGTEIVSATGLKPGDSRTGTLTITNNGDYAANYMLSIASLTNAPASPALSSTLDLTVDDITGATITRYVGKLGAVTSTAVGSFSAGATRTYRFTISWPVSDQNPLLQGAQTSLVFKWTASV
jgi:hypothetical protein